MPCMQTYIQNLQHPDLLVTISSLQIIVFPSLQITCTILAHPEGIRDRNQKL